MLIRSHRQEVLSRAYIHAIAARCGMLCSFRELDYGIDLTIHQIDRVGSRYRESGFALDVQAKSTTAALAMSDRVRYDMEVKAYEDLRQVVHGTPRVLVLLLLPEEEDTWTEQQEDHLLLRRCAYWMSLRGLPPTANTATIRIDIPRSNLFSIDALNRLFEKIRKGEAL